MTQQNINVGIENGKTGDKLFDAFTKVEANFTDLYGFGHSNRIFVKEAADLSGSLLSTVEYFIDGIIDMGTQSIEVPAGGLNLAGYNFDISQLVSTASNYTMFTSPVGGCGNILGKDYAISASGTNSKVYDLTSLTGFESFELVRVNYNSCSSLGEMNNFRQGLEVGTGRFGGSPNLVLTGVWVGGYFIDTSIVRNLDAGMTGALFEAGTGFLMSSRFRSNQNIDLPASASFFDFAASNFINPSTVQIMGAIITRGGVSDPDDTNIIPNMSPGDLVASWTGNDGMLNTFKGGSIGVTTSTPTTITTISTFVDLAATLWTSTDLQHFDSPADGQLRHLGISPHEYRVTANITLDSTANNEVTLRILKWDNSASTFITVLDQTRQINNLVGGRDISFFMININTTLDQNDYIKLQVANLTAANDITAETDSYYIVEER